MGGVQRSACVYRPAGAGANSPRPLVVWFHPGGEGGDVAERETKLLDKATAFDVSGDSSRPGFVLAVVQGRNLHFPTKGRRDGRHHDFYYRDLASPSSNPDIASADRLVDDLLADGGVDPKRIYAMGWSNGGFFGQLYAIARHDRPSPGGARVAAAAVFATADPFHDIGFDPFAQAPPTGRTCRLDTYPKSDVPILLAYRTCDLATPCGSEDSSCFSKLTGSKEEPGYITSTWLADAKSRGITAVQGLLIGGRELGISGWDTEPSSCSAPPSCSLDSCTKNPAGIGCLCLLNHMRWPDGAYNNGLTGVDREPVMLNFLREHPLGS
jgi:pimeloyl-ACP methyl ester carboxylesterase